MKILKQNSKMKRTSKYFGVKVMNWPIPAYNVKSGKYAGKVTCPFASACKAYCYASKGRYNMPNVKDSQAANYEITRQLNFTNIMNQSILEQKPDYVRIHDSGDFYSKYYLAAWIEVCESNPNTRFFAYTKSYRFFIDPKTGQIQKGLLPDNFDICLSKDETHKDFGLVDWDNVRHSAIFPDLETLQKSGYVDCHNYDLYMSKWFNPGGKVGLIIH